MKFRDGIRHRAKKNRLRREGMHIQSHPYLMGGNDVITDLGCPLLRLAYFRSDGDELSREKKCVHFGNWNRMFCDMTHSFSMRTMAVWIEKNIVEINLSAEGNTAGEVLIQHGGNPYSWHIPGSRALRADANGEIATGSKICAIFISIVRKMKFHNFIQTYPWRWHPP